LVGRPLGKPRRKDNFRMELVEMGCKICESIHIGSKLWFFTEGNL
jgi:hypothetical protein